MSDQSENRELLRRLDSWTKADNAAPLIGWAAAHLRGCIAAAESDTDRERLLDAVNPMRTGRYAGMICGGGACMPSCHAHDERLIASAFPHRTVS